MLVDEWSDGERTLWRNFDESEVACRCGCGKLPAARLMRALQELRDALGFALPVTSGARCPDHNASVSSTGRTGPHTTGLAVDIWVHRWRAVLLIRAAVSRPIWTGFGLNQKGGGRFIHLDMIEPGSDTNPRPTTWTY